MGTKWSPDLSGFDGPKYMALLHALRADIATGRLAAGVRLPPVRELAWSLQITPGTVARAYRKATDEGILEAAVGRGTFVKGRETGQDTQVATSLLLQDDSNGKIDLRGSKNPQLGQDRDIQRAFVHLASAPNPNYVLHPKADSDLTARQAACDWLTYTGIEAMPEDIALAYGAQNAVLLALQTLLHGTSPTIVTDELVFPGMRHAARVLRADMVSVERDQDGILPEKLEQICRRHAPQVLLSSFNVHNPTTGTTTLERRLQIALVAEKFDLKIIDDDAYGTFSSNLPQMCQIARKRVWHATSLSKSFASGLRFGFLVTPPGQGGAARAVLQSSCYGMSSPLIDLATQVIIDGSAEKMRVRINSFNRQRVQIALNTLGRWNLRWRNEVPFLWLLLPTGWRSSSFLRACEQRGILLRAADEFALIGGKAPNAVRIAIGADVAQKTYETALQTIGELLENPPVSMEI